MQKELISKIPKSVVLAVDAGGTNTNIALCSITGKKVKIHVKYTFESQKLKRFEDAVKQVLKDSKVKIKSACIAAACPVSADRKTCKLTHAGFKIDTRKLPFKCLLLNDFEALGYSINVLQTKDIKIVRKGSSNKLPIALIGAGTGLGISMLYFERGLYVAHASEGGHADLPIIAEEFPILSWLSIRKNVVEYEDVLSGRGIIALHNFYLTRLKGERTRDPAEIMNSNSPAATAAKKQFIKFYARCAKNFALDGLTRGGIVIGGGIAAKNPKIFGKDFIKEFMRNNTQQAILKKIPIKVITNYDVSLLGAAFASQCKEWFR